MLMNAHIWSTGAALMRAVVGNVPSTVANMSGLRLGCDAEPSKEGLIHGSPLRILQAALFGGIAIFRQT
jgi:hypothetical protein